MYYDMSGFDYGILDVVQVLHLRKRRGNYYDCPFCGETHGKLNINVEKNVFRCNRCDASGGMLKLYADLHNVTLSEANQQIREALGKGEYRLYQSNAGTGRKGNGRACTHRGNPPDVSENAVHAHA